MEYIETAEKFYLVPLKDQESLYWVGGPKNMLALEMVMDEKDEVARGGINTETCYIIVNKTGEECDELLNKMREIMRKGQDADNKRKPKKN